jgi:hypothetical protein
MNSWADHAPELLEYKDDDEDDYDEEEEYLDDGSVGGGPGGASLSRPCVKPACAPRAQWRATPVVQGGGVGGRGGALGVGPKDQPKHEPKPPPEYSFSVSTFGSDDAFVTTVAAGQVDAVAMLNSPHAPSWLATTLARGSFDAANLQIGVPSITGSREERSIFG